MLIRKNLATTLLCAFVASTSLTACDQLRDRLASVISSKSPEEALISVRQHLDGGRFKNAKSEAQAYADKPGERQAEFALAMAQACISLNEVNLALQYLGVALASGRIDAPSLMADPSFAPVRTDMRFLSLLTSSPVQTGNARPEPAAPAAPAEPATSVRIDGQGIEAKAGSVSVKLPN